MSKLPLILYPNKILETPAVPVTEFNAELEQLVRDMLTTMYAAKGIGLAAPQVGILKQIIVFGGGPQDSSISEGYIINPTLVVSTGKNTLSEEGCLSFPKLSALVPRWSEVTVHGKNVKGEDITIVGTGLLAIVLQHELDHLEGKTFLNYLSKLKRDIIKKKMDKYQKTLTQEKFKELMLNEILRQKQVANDSSGPGGNAGIERSESDTAPVP